MQRKEKGSFGYILIQILLNLKKITTLFYLSSYITYSFCRYGLERNYNSTTIFTLHLAFIDLCFCVICIPQYTFAYIAEQWPFGEFLCQWSGPIIFLITFVDWICLGFIALSRCLNMTKPKMWNNFCNKKTNVALILIGMWALSALMTLPSFLEVFAFKYLTTSNITTSKIF